MQAAQAIAKEYTSPSKDQRSHMESFTDKDLQGKKPISLRS